MKKRAIQICITVALSFGVYRLLGWWALAIWATLLIVWATTARSRRQGTWRAAQASMTAEDFMQQIEEQVNRADELVNSRQYDDARLIYERVTEVVRALRESQLHTVPGQTISLSHRVMVANRTLAVPLDRLGELHLSLGNRSAASRYFQEVVELMEEAVPHAGGETRAEFESLVATAKDKAAAIEPVSTSLLPQSITREAYEARYLRLIAQIMRVPGVASEATLLLARRILQRRLDKVSDADLKAAILEVCQLPNYECIAESEIDGFVRTQGPHTRFLANELANVYRDYIRLV